VKLTTFVELESLDEKKTANGRACSPSFEAEIDLESGPD
jgi:hypothetical protein